MAIVGISTWMFLWSLGYGAHAFTPPSTGFSAMTQRYHRPTTTMPLQGVLDFVEPETGVKVRLIGAMHYNPWSIKLTEESIKELHQDGRLGSVLIESCPSRWNSTLNLPSPVTKLLVSEMRTAHDLALDFGRPIVLGDQDIETTVDRMKEGLGDTLRCIVNPRRWKELSTNLTYSWDLAVPSGNDYSYLGPVALLDPRLILSAPVSFFKYPLSYFVKDPLKTTIVLGLLFGADVASAAALGQPTTVLDATAQVFLNPSTLSYGWTDAVVDLMGSVLETIIFGSLFLQVLLVERNRVLARNILEQCRYHQQNQSNLGQLISRAFKGSTAVPLAETSPRPSQLKGDDTVVVAVLGMAHVNGIRKLLEERLVQ